MESVNPYESPKSKTYDSNLETYQPKLLSSNGRIGRLRYLGYSLIAMIIFGFILGLIASLAIPNMPETSAMIMMVVLYIPLLVFSIIFAKRRFNDLNHSGWWQLIIYIPFVGILVALYLLLWPGTKGSNNYGPPPTKNSGLLIIGGLIVPIFLTGILAAIAIPAYQDYVERAKQAVESTN